MMRRSIHSITCAACKKQVMLASADADCPENWIEKIRHTYEGPQTIALCDRCFTIAEMKTLSSPGSVWHEFVSDPDDTPVADWIVDWWTLKTCLAIAMAEVDARLREIKRNPPWGTNRRQELARIQGFVRRYVSESRDPLVHADLSGRDLRCAGLSHANLRWATLTKADLTWADLRYTNLGGAKCGGAEFTDAEMHGANLSHTDLSGCVLKGADLTCAERRIEAPYGWEIRRRGELFRIPPPRRQSNAEREREQRIRAEEDSIRSQWNDIYDEHRRDRASESARREANGRYRGGDWD